MDSAHYPCVHCNNPPRECTCDFDFSVPKCLSVCSKGVWIWVSRSPFGTPDIRLSIGTGLGLVHDDIRNAISTLLAWSERLSEILPAEEIDPHNEVMSLVRKARQEGKGYRRVASMLNRRWDDMRNAARNGDGAQGVTAGFEMKEMGISRTKILEAIRSDDPFTDDYPIDWDYVKKKIARCKALFT